jgi:hypothetical protein
LSTTASDAITFDGSLSKDHFILGVSMSVLSVLHNFRGHYRVSANVEEIEPFQESKNLLSLLALHAHWTRGKYEKEARARWRDWVVHRNLRQAVRPTFDSDGVESMASFLLKRRNSVRELKRDCDDVTVDFSFAEVKAVSQRFCHAIIAEEDVLNSMLLFCRSHPAQIDTEDPYLGVQLSFEAAVLIAHPTIKPALTEATELSGANWSLGDRMNALGGRECYGHLHALLCEFMIRAGIPSVAQGSKLSLDRALGVDPNLFPSSYPNPLAMARMLVDKLRQAAAASTDNFPDYLFIHLLESDYMHSFLYRQLLPISTVKTTSGFDHPLAHWGLSVMLHFNILARQTVHAMLLSTVAPTDSALPWEIATVVSEYLTASLPPSRPSPNRERNSAVEKAVAEAVAEDELERLALMSSGMSSDAERILFFRTRVRILFVLHFC